MRILFLAPQPFFQERGTPIAVDLAVRVLSERGHHVDLLVYHEGRDVSYPGVTLHRIPRLPFVRGVRPGFSGKKLVCDFFMFFKALALMIRHRPDVVHAVEESVFMAWVLRFFFRTPYIYDMDSSIPDQIVEKFPRLSALRPVLMAVMKPAMFSALMIVPVCEALGATLGNYPAERIIVIRDVSLLDGDDKDPDGPGSKHSEQK
jgi:hypothetical protein